MSVFTVTINTGLSDVWHCFSTYERAQAWIDRQKRARNYEWYREPLIIERSMDEAADLK